jgi:hypothetical protein
MRIYNRLKSKFALLAGQVVVANRAFGKPVKIFYQL